MLANTFTSKLARANNMKIKLVKGDMVKMIDGQARIDACLADGWSYADKPIEQWHEETADPVDVPKRRGRPPKGE